MRLGHPITSCAYSFMRLAHPISLCTLIIQHAWTHPITNLLARNNLQVWAQNIRISPLVYSHKSTTNTNLLLRINHSIMNLPALNTCKHILYPRPPQLYMQNTPNRKLPLDHRLMQPKCRLAMSQHRLLGGSGAPLDALVHLSLGGSISTARRYTSKCENFWFFAAQRRS